MKVILKEHKFTLDWYTIKDREIETDDFCYFEMQCRGDNCDWFLIHYKNVNGEIKNAYEYDFRLSEPWEAVIKLSDKIKGFNHLHAKSVVENLNWLMKAEESRCKP